MIADLLLACKCMCEIVDIDDAHLQVMCALFVCVFMCMCVCLQHFLFFKEL